MRPSIKNQLARAKAFRLDMPSVGEAGLAFLIAYAAAYFFSQL